MSATQLHCAWLGTVSLLRVYRLVLQAAVAMLAELDGCMLHSSHCFSNLRPEDWQLAGTPKQIRDARAVALFMTKSHNWHSKTAWGFAKWCPRTAVRMQCCTCCRGCTPSSLLLCKAASCLCYIQFSRACFVEHTHIRKASCTGLHDSRRRSGGVETTPFFVG